MIVFIFKMKLYHLYSRVFHRGDIEEDIFIWDCNLSIVRRILAVSQSYSHLKYHSHTSHFLQGFTFLQLKIFYSDYREIFSYQL